MHMSNFFVDYMINDNLGKIANAFIAFADFEEEGASCKQCIALSELHSTAVDFIKSGIPADFPHNLQPDLVPSFMENKFKKVYDSEKILGKIYRECESKLLPTKFITKCVEFDSDLCVPGFENYVLDGTKWMSCYNYDLWELMKHYGYL